MSQLFREFREDNPSTESLAILVTRMPGEAKQSRSNSNLGTRGKVLRGKEKIAVGMRRNMSEHSPRFSSRGEEWRRSENAEISDGKTGRAAEVSVKLAVPQADAFFCARMYFFLSWNTVLDGGARPEIYESYILLRGARARAREWILPRYL